MYSYPNLIPLTAREVEAIAASVAPYAFDRIYSHFFDRVIATGAKQVFGDLGRALSQGDPGLT